MGNVFTEVVGKLGQHVLGKGLQAGHFAERLAPVVGQGRLQDARGTGVAGLDVAPDVQHDHACGEVVQDGLKVGARRVDLAHAVLHRRPGIGELLRHVGKRAGQPAQFVLALERGFGRQVAQRHLPHAFGQHQQWFGKLVAQQHRQQHGAKYGQKKAEREGADVHPAQTAARQRTLLVLAIGLLHGDGVGHQRCGQNFGHL